LQRKKRYFQGKLSPGGKKDGFRAEKAKVAIYPVLSDAQKMRNVNVYFLALYKKSFFFTR